MIYNNLFHNNPGYLKMPGILPFLGYFLFCYSDIDGLLYIDYLDIGVLSAILSVQRPCNLLFGCEFNMARSEGYDIIG